MQHTSSLGGLRDALRVCDSGGRVPSVVSYWRVGADMPLDVDKRRRKLRRRGPIESSVIGAAGCWLPVLGAVRSMLGDLASFGEGSLCGDTSRERAIEDVVKIKGASVLE